jgi:hypothetical protein
MNQKQLKNNHELNKLFSEYRHLFLWRIFFIVSKYHFDSSSDQKRLFKRALFMIAYSLLKQTGIVISVRKYLPKNKAKTSVNLF